MGTKISKYRYAEYQAEKRKYDENQEDREDDFCDSRRRTGQTGKSQGSSDQRDDSENER